jgi:hypothetical protein
MHRSWQKRLLLLCVLAMLAGQQLTVAHVFSHFDAHQSGDCHDCDALKNFKAGLLSVPAPVAAAFDGIHFIHGSTQPPCEVTESPHPIRAPPFSHP